MQQVEGCKKKSTKQNKLYMSGSVTVCRLKLFKNGSKTEGGKVIYQASYITPMLEFFNFPAPCSMLGGDLQMKAEHPYNTNLSTGFGGGEGAKTMGQTDLSTRYWCKLSVVSSNFVREPRYCNFSFCIGRLTYLFSPTLPSLRKRNVHGPRHAIMHLQDESHIQN